jgi:hypothetical protein
MRIPYLFGVLPVIGDNATSVTCRAAPFIVSALIDNTVPVAFGASFFSHLCGLPDRERTLWARMLPSVIGGPR